VRLGLVGRVYLVTISCAVLVVGSCAVVLAPPRLPPFRASFGEMLVRVAACELERPGAPVRFALGEFDDISVSLFDADGRLLASNRDAPAAPLAAAELARLDDPESGAIRLAPGVSAARFAVPGGPSGYGVIVDPNAPERHPPPLLLAALIALGLLSGAALLFARSLARPLRRLAGAARRFAAGEFTARVQLARRDEVGQVAAAFDELADRVQALLRAQRELLANVSHELRTPLSRLRVGLDLVAEAGPAARAELAGLEEDIAALDRLVADVLAVASLDLASLREDAAGPLHVELLDLAELCRRAAGRWAAVPGCRLRVEAPPRVVVDGDATLLRRVVDNLVENARKYSEPGTEIVLALAVEGERAVLTVRDRGIGIAAADLPHIFTPFFRADRSRTRRTGGVGLGLTLAQRIVRAHGGSIALASRPGEGTTVTVVLPVAAPTCVEA
jgi:signal transduction histidine kinase